MANSAANIFVTHVESFHDLVKIWGQTNRTCATYIEKHLHMLTPELCKLSGPNPNTVCKDMLCFANSDGIYYRARVISDVFNNSVAVLFIDYGNREWVDLSNIRLVNDSNENVSSVVPQAEEFYLANVGSRGGWLPAVINGIRHDLCSREHKYRISHHCDNQKFIQIFFQSKDYANYLIRKDIARHVPSKEQILVFKNAMKSLQQNVDYVNRTFADGQNFVYQPLQRGTVNGEYSNYKVLPKQNYPPNVTMTNPNQGPPNMNPQVNIRQNNGNPTQNNVNNNIMSPSANSGQVLNPVVIEALANELKQHLFKDPDNVNTSASHHSYVTQVLDVGTTHSVYVSFIDDGPWSFSVQLVANEHELNKLVDDLAECKLVPVKLPITLGYPCIAKSIQYENCCRGVIVNVSHSAVKVFYVDFGNTEDLPLTNIFEMPAKFFKIKTMSQKFALSGLQRVKPSEDIKKAFVEVVENELLLLHVTTLEGENLPTCDLYLKNVNIKRLLNEKVRHVRQCEPIELPRLGEIENVVVTWVDSPTRFYVQLKKNDKELTNLKNELAECGANGEGFNPEEIIPGVLCLSRFTADNQWYRAVIMSVNSKTSVTVSYIDYGNRETVNPSELRKAGHGMARQLNSQAIQCSLYGYEENKQDTGINALLEELVLEKELCIKVMATQKDRIVVKLFDDNGDVLTALNRRRSQPSAKAPDNATKEETVKTSEKKTDSNRAPEVKSPTNRSPRDQASLFKNFRSKQDEKSPKKEAIADTANWRSEERVKFPPKKVSPKEEKTGRGQHHPTRKSNEKEPPAEKSWRNSEEDWRNSNKKNKKPAKSVNERLQKAAKENEKRGQQIADLNKLPVKIENVALFGSSYREKEIQAGSVEDVIVTYFMNPNEVYVQLLSTGNDFKKLMDEIQNYYVNKLPIVKVLQKGELVISKFKQDNVMYRALVTETNPLTVRYVDYGNEEVTERERLWPMDKTFLELEVQALKCSLPNLSPNGRDSWPEPDPEIDKIFEHEKYSCKFLNSANGVREVELTILENGKSVRDELISAGFAVPVDPVKQPEKDITDSITDKSPPIDFTLMKGEILNVYVTHIVDPSEFFVQMEFNVWEAVEKELKEYVESKDPTPLLKNTINELCLVKVGEEWFRARIIEKTDSGANIQLIDYGKKLDVTNDQIKHIPDNLAGYPPQAVQCSIDCDSEVPSNVADEFKKCEKNYYIGFVQDISKNRLRLTLYNPDGSKLECLRSVNDAPIEVCPVGNLPLFHKETTVMVSYIASPNEVYIHRKADSSAVEELHTLLTEFYNTGGEDFQQDESNYKICAAKSTADNCWYRARVLSLNGQSVTVFYIDYGNVETVPVENVKNLDRTLYEQHAFAKKVSLNIDCDEDCVGEMTEKLCGLLENKEVVGFFAKVDDITYAELILDGTSVSDTLNAKKINNDLFKPMVKPEEDNAIRVYISHVTSPNEFWVNEERICQELIAFQEKIQNICAEGSPKKDVRVGDIVGGIFTDQLWYRMKVLGIEDKIVDVQFIDYGNSLKIDTSENVMIELPQDVVDVPVFAGYCSLKGRWKSEAAARFEEIITNHQDLFTLVELDNKNPRCVDLLQNGSSVTQQLISEGLEDEDGDKFVYISHINSPSDFYIRTGSNKELFDKVTSAMLEGDKFPDAKGEVGQIYCAKFPKDDSHRRARVVKIDADSITVNFIDHGMICTVENVKELPEDLGKMPALARNCGLVYGNCIDTWSDAACDKFKEYLNQRFTLETVAEGYARSLVKLFTEDGKELTTILSDLCEEDGRTYVYVSHANSPNDFYIQNVVDENFGIITGRLVDGDALEDLKEKKVGAYCAAKDPQNDIWSRAEIKKIIGDQCELFFPDFGSTALSAELKELPEDVRFLPPAAKWCSLNLPIANVPECLKEEFANMTGGGDSIFRSRVIRPGDCTIVSLISDGKKLEEVLLLSENLIFDGENQQPGIDAGECEDSAFEDSDLKENYTDEEKTVIFSISREGFRSDDEKGLEKSSDALKYIGRNECQDSFEDTSMKESESDTNLNVTNSTNDSNSDDKVDQEECRTKLGKTLLEDKIVPGSIAMGVVPDTDDTRELSTVTAESEKPFAQNHSG